jgi:hypothetical protein
MLQLGDSSPRHTHVVKLPLDVVRLPGLFLEVLAGQPIVIGVQVDGALLQGAGLLHQVEHQHVGGERALRIHDDHVAGAIGDLCGAVDLDRIRGQHHVAARDLDRSARRDDVGTLIVLDVLGVDRHLAGRVLAEVR